MHEVIFDIETQRLFSDLDNFDPKGLGVSIVSAYVRTLNNENQEIEGKMLSFWENELSDLWPHFQVADRIIGFNSLSFDIPVLQGYTNLPLKKLNHFDIMLKFKNIAGHRISLNHLAIHNLGAQKTDVGTNAVLYYQKGDPESLKKLKEYCEADVKLTKDLYDFAKKEGKLKYQDKWNTKKEIEVDFSYPKPDPISQESLF